MKLWAVSQSQLAEHLSLLVAQPHCVVNFCLVLVNKATGKRCCAGDDRPGMTLGPGIYCLSLHLLCPVGGLGRAPFWHVFVPATVLGCNSNFCTSACAGQVSRQGCLLGLCWFTSEICYCWYQPRLYHKKSSRPRARAAMLHIFELWLGVGWATVRLRGSVWSSRIAVTGASRIRTYAG